MIVLIDNYDSFTFNLYQVIAEVADDILVVRNDKKTVDEIVALKPSGIVISPGPGRPEDGGIGVELIKKMAPSVPILGICLGHQMISVAFGGEVVLTDEPVHGKETYVFHHRQGLYQDLPLPFRAGRYHSLIVDKSNLPAELLIEAENQQGLLMGVRHKHYLTYGVQFHPESIMTPCGNQLIKNFIALC